MKYILYAIIIILSATSCNNHTYSKHELAHMLQADCIDGFYQTSNFNGAECWYEKIQDEENQFIKCNLQDGDK